MSDQISVAGATAPSGKKFYIARQGSNVACVAKSSLRVGSNAFVDVLDSADITLFTHKDNAAFREQAKAVDAFPPAAIAEQIGWNGDFYALQDGCILTPSPSETILGFKPLTDRISRTGAFPPWRNRLAGPLAGHVLGELALMIAFVAPLLRFMPDVKNFAVCIVAPAGKGKTTLLDFAASEIGNPSGVGIKPYWISLYATDNSLEDRMVECRDHALLLDDFSRMTAGQSRKERSAALTKLSYLIEGGTMKGRKGEKEVEPCRFVALMTANEGTLDLIDQHNQNDVAAADRLLAIRVPQEWKAGVYKSVCEPFADGPAFSDAAMAAARRFHGTAYRHYMRKLVRLAASDRDALCQRLRDDIAEFLRLTGENLSEGTDYRVARSFGAIYAAAKLACEFRTLPDTFNPARTVIEAYRFHLAERPVQIPFIERLEALATHPDVLDIATLAKGEKSQAAANAALGTLHHRSGYLELRIHPSKIGLSFRDWDRIKSNATVVGSLIRHEESHLARKASLAPGMPKTRLLCFKIPIESAG